VTRSIGHPVLWVQEVTTTFFVYGIFIGTAAAARRNDHLYLSAIAEAMTGRKRLLVETFNRLVLLGAALCMVYFGFINFIEGFHAFRMPSLTPLATLYAPIPLSGVLVALFAIEQLVNGWRNGFAGSGKTKTRPSKTSSTRPMTAFNGLIVGMMATLFLVFGYLGVPVAFSLIAGVLIGTLFTPVSLPSIITQLFNGIDSEALMAIPFFLLVGELMTSANVIVRIADLSQALVGHIRGGLAQVVTVFSMFFSGMSGSSSADVAVLSRTMAKPMAAEGYDAAFVAALIAAAATIANLVPPSIMAVVYGAIGNVSIAGLFLGGIVPGFMVGFGLMIYCYFFGPPGHRRPRSSFGQLGEATKAAGLPLVIPVILLGGILTGWFTPTEAGVIAITYILVVVIPILNRGHLRHLPRDFAMPGSSIRCR
jgi:TRAP-type C4-dicarboxylate transport system permease small subunit